MSFIPNSSPKVLTGTLGQMPLASKQKIGTIYVVTDQLPNVLTYAVTISGTTKSWSQASGSVPPASPTYYVSSTGSNTAAGALATPLATVSEGLRRLAITKWSGQAKIVVLDSINEGSAPVWNIPAPIGGALPLLIQGTMTQVLGTTTPTGGTTGTLTTPTTATITSAAAGAANAYRGMICRFTAGATLSGSRRPVSSNDGAGGFTLGGTLDAAPGADPADRFIIENHVGKVTYSGEKFFISAPGGVHIDLLEFDPTTATTTSFEFAGIVQTTACKIVSAGAGSTYVGMIEGTWVDGCERIPLFTLPSGVTACGSVFDGRANDLFFFCDGGSNTDRHYVQGAVYLNVDVTGQVNASLQFESCVFNTCSFQMIDYFGMEVSFAYSIINAPRVSPSLGGDPITLANIGFAFIYVNINGANVAGTVISAQACHGSISGLIGANTATNCLVATSATEILLFSQPTMSPTVAGNACKVGALAAASWATVWNGGVSAKAVQTDLADAASQMVRVGP